LVRRAAALLTLAIWAGGAQAECRQALALGLDVSGSVDRREYRLQLDGLAAALADTDVRAAFLAMPGALVRLAVFEWAGPGQQRLLVDWTEIVAADRLAAISDRLRGTESIYDDPSTAIGAAMRHGARLLRRQAGCWRQTLDISGDGPSNSGPQPRDVLDPVPPGLTVNGLVVVPLSRANIDKDLSRVKTLRQYYRAEVVRGPGAFVETAADFEDFARAMRRKLLRELSGAMLSRAARPRAAPQ